MNMGNIVFKHMQWSMILLIAALSACGGGGSRDPILGATGNAEKAPAVTAVSPADGATGVSTATTAVNVTFDEPIAAFTGGSSFTVTCAAPCTNPTGTVSVSGANTAFTFTSGTTLEPDTLYTVTVTGATSAATGLPTETPFVSQFTTAAAVVPADPPMVITVVPADSAMDLAATTTTVDVTFDQAIAPITGTSSFTVTCSSPCVNPVGTVALNAANTIATYTLASGTTFEQNTTYTATVTGATGLDNGLAMTSPFVSQFSMASAPTVTDVLPLDEAQDVSLDTSVSATFDVAVDALAGSGFTLTCATPCTNPTGAVTMSGGGTVATFTLDTGTTLEPGTTYTATVTGATGVDSGYSMVSPYMWTFTSTARPRVTAVAPFNKATGVPINNTVINAAFTEAMAPLTGAASFTLTCALCTVPNPAGSVSLDTATSKIATFELNGGVVLEASSVYTATITAAQSLGTGLTIKEPFIWTFTTGLTADVTRPRVVSTFPETTIPGPTGNIPVNTAIRVVFTEDMNPGTVTAPGTITLSCEPACVSPDGDVTYVVGSRTATFTPNPLVDLDGGVTYTGKVSTAALDLAGNALAGNTAPLPGASDYEWTFSMAAATPVPAADIEVLSVVPLDGAIGVCPNATVNATFDVPSGFQMDPASINALTFTVFETLIPLNTVTASSVILDGLTDVATFTPQNDLVAGTEYTATVKGEINGVKDLAIPANTMQMDFSWSFTAGPATGACLASPGMGVATPFAIAATAGLSNAPTAPVTVINGDVVLDPNQTCNSVNVPNDGTFGLCAGSPPTLNGQVITNTFPNTTDSGFIKADLNAAFLEITPPAGPPAAGSLSGGTTFPAPSTVGEPTGSPPVFLDNYFTPGVYTAPAALNISGDITLDGLGDGNAVFIFQVGSALNIAAGAVSPGPHTRILMTGGTKASNIWWQVGSSATIGTFAEFNGNVLAAFDITLENGASSCGRMMAGAWSGGNGALVFEANSVSIPGNGCPP